MSLYPVTIVKDRYSGCYSGGKWIAWNLHLEDIPNAWDDDDYTCAGFWGSEHIWARPVGKGNTPEEALADLEHELEAQQDAIKRFP